MKELSYLKNSLTIPNILSVIRIVLIWPFIRSVINDCYFVSAVILIISGLSDLLDGIIARKFNQITQLGKMLDPIADKLTLMSVMICVGIKFPKMFCFMIILLIKEIAMLIAGGFLLKRKKVPPAAKWYGKFATVVFYASVIVIIGCKALWNFDSEILDISLMSLTVFCMIYALFRYLEIFVSMIKNDKSSN